MRVWTAKQALWYASQEYDEYCKPWRTDVTVQECLGAGSLASAHDQLHLQYKRPRYSRGHDFQGVACWPATHCNNCGISWSAHVDLPQNCYVEPANAPKDEDAQDRIDHFNEVFGDACNT